MSASVATTPVVPLAGRECLVTATASTGNLVKLWCTSAPAGSRLRDELDKTGATRVPLLGSLQSGKGQAYTFDKGGAYALELEEYTKGATAYGGGYAGDPNSFQTETKIGSDTQTLHVAQQLTCQLGIAPDTATLLLHVLDDTIVLTTLEAHGVVSPVVTKALSRIAKNAADATTVKSSVSGLVNTSAAVAIGDLAAEVDNFRIRFGLHEAQSGVHADDDTVNLISGAFALTTDATLDGIKRALAEARQRFYDHITNNDPTSPTPGIGSGTFHSAADWAANPRAQQAGDILTCRVLMADLWRCFEAHRVSAVHDNPDTVNALAALSPLDVLHRNFITVIASLTPTVATNESEAASLLVNAGFQDQ